MKKVAVGAMKGGVGKTMLAVNISSVLAQEYGKKVLMIDADPQANTTNYLGIDEYEDGYVGLRDMIENNLDPRSAVRNTVVEGLEILGGSIYTTVLELALHQLPAREHRIRNYLDDYKEFFNTYDYIVFDTNPGMGLVNQNVFVAADKILVITDASTGGAKGIDLFVDLWIDIAGKMRLGDNKIEALILNKVESNTNISKEFKEYLKTGDYKELALDTSVNQAVAFKDAESYHRPINLHKPKSKQNEQIQSVVKELFVRGIL